MCASACVTGFVLACVRVYGRKANTEKGAREGRRDVRAGRVEERRKADGRADEWAEAGGRAGGRAAAALRYRSATA